MRVGENNMIKLSTLIRVVIVALAIGLLAQLSAGGASWASTGQDAMRQTLPTFTFTPGPVIPTDTPLPPPPATNTPVAPTPDTPVTATPMVSVTATVSITPTGATVEAPSTLPEAGSGPLLLGGGMLLLASGALSLLVGGRVRRRRR